MECCYFYVLIEEFRLLPKRISSRTFSNYEQFIRVDTAFLLWMKIQPSIHRQTDGCGWVGV